MITFFSNKQVFQNFSFDQLFNIDGLIIRSGKNRETLEFIHNKKKYYIKRFKNGSIIDQALYRFGIKKFCNDAFNEYQAYAFLKAIGILTPRLVCFGTEKKLLNNRTFVISEKISNFIQLDTFLETKNNNYPKQLQTNIYCELVNMINKLHTNGIIHHDLYLCHFLMDLNSFNKNKIKFYLIDYHRLEKKTEISNTLLIKELGDLLFSIKYFGNHKLFLQILNKKYCDLEFLTSNFKFIDRRANQLLTKYKKKYG
jgi:heptose I phosphotransferase